MHRRNLLCTGSVLREESWLSGQDNASATLPTDKITMVHDSGEGWCWDRKKKQRDVVGCLRLKYCHFWLLHELVVGWINKQDVVAFDAYRSTNLLILILLLLSLPLLRRDSDCGYQKQGCCAAKIITSTRSPKSSPRAYILYC